jgi:hypothetical protein
MPPGSRTRWARPLTLVAGVAAGIAGVAGLGVYLFALRYPQVFCLGIFGFCTYRYSSFIHTQLPEQVVTAKLLWVLPFLTVAVGAAWDATRTSRSGRLVLWVGTGQMLVATALGCSLALLSCSCQEPWSLWWRRWLLEHTGGRAHPIKSSTLVFRHRHGGLPRL